MVDISKEIKGFVKSIRNRMLLAKLIQNIIYSFGVAAIISTVMVIVSIFMPIAFIYNKMIWVLCASVSCSVILAFIKGPDMISSARLIDSRGLKERTSTALELLNEDDNENPYKEMVIKDAHARLMNVDKKGLVSFIPSKSSLITLIFAGLVLLVSVLVPAPNRDLVIEKENVITEKKKTEKELEKVKKEIKKDKYLSDAEKKKIEKLLEQSKKDILSTKNSKEIIKKTEATKKLVDMKKNHEKSLKFKEATKKLMENKSMKDIGKSLANKEFNKASMDIDKLMKELNKMSDEELKELLDSLPEPLDGLSKEELQQALNQMASEMAKLSDSMENNQCTLDKAGEGT